MVEGYVNEALEPVVEIGLKRGDVVTMIPVVVDTGFGGYLCLAERWTDQLEMTFEYAESYELADGKVITTDVFRGVILFDGQEQKVDVILTASDDTLIGASLFKGYQVTIDYPRRHVRMERGLKRSSG
jgi:clan AA aspartic protease